MTKMSRSNKRWANLLGQLVEDKTGVRLLICVVMVMLREMIEELKIQGGHRETILKETSQ
jgi:hypothetical protein